MSVQLASNACDVVVPVVPPVAEDKCEDDPSSTVVVVVVVEEEKEDSDPTTFSRFTIASCSMLCMPKKTNIRKPTRAI